VAVLTGFGRLGFGLGVGGLALAAVVGEGGERFTGI
jgi:hypothetical protein